MFIPSIPADAVDPWLKVIVGRPNVVKLWETMALDQAWKGAMTAAVLLLIINAVAEKIRSRNAS